MSERVCGEKCEVYSRVVGYIRPIGQWNAGKLAEYSERVAFRSGNSTRQDVEVDGDSLAALGALLLDHLCGQDSVTVHAEADWLRTNGHALAGEILEILATARDSVSG